MKISQQQHDEQLAWLRKRLKSGDTIYTVLRHVSASGMTRHIAFVLQRGTRKEPVELHPNYAIATILGYRQAKDGSLIVSGCGMDMGFAVVYNLGATLWPKGTKKPHGTRNGEPDSDGGYALKHRWL